MSKWSAELTKKLETEISRIMPEEIEYLVLLYVEDGKYDSTMKDMSVFDYFEIAVKKPSPLDNDNMRIMSRFIRCYSFLIL